VEPACVRSCAKFCACAVGEFGPLRCADVRCGADKGALINFGRSSRFLRIRFADGWIPNTRETGVTVEPRRLFRRFLPRPAASSAVAMSLIGGVENMGRRRRAVILLELIRWGTLDSWLEFAG